MATIIEQTRTTEIPRINSTTNGKRRVRSKESVNRFLMKNENYEYVNRKLEKRNYNSPQKSGIAARLSAGIGFFLKTDKIGRIYISAHFQIGANKRIPDVAFVSADKIPPTGEPLDIWNFAPDLAIEVISPSERHNKVERKIREYFDAGVTQVWKIVPEFKTLTIYFSPTETKTLTEKDEITCEDILPKFRLKLSEIFID